MLAAIAATASGSPHVAQNGRGEKRGACCSPYAAQQERKKREKKRADRENGEPGEDQNERTVEVKFSANQVLAFGRRERSIQRAPQDE